MFRPALIGKSPDAIINRIDENLLLKAGQKKGLIMFFALVDKDGTVKMEQHVSRHARIQAAGAGSAASTDECENDSGNSQS